MIGASLKCLRKPFRIDGGGGDDEFEIRAPGQQLLEVAQQKIDVQAALVRLVDDDGVVGVAARSVCVSASKMPSVITLIKCPRGPCR